MAFGILEPIGSPFPSGTVLLEDAKQLVRSPHPSASPDDPLNWSRSKKELAFATILFGSSICGVLGPILVPAFGIIAQDFGISLTQVLLLNGALIMGLGVSAYVCPVLAGAFGNRLTFLGTTLLLIISCVWAGSAQSYISLIAARTFQGLGMGSWWGVAGTISLTELYFVHERGRRAGLWNLSVIVSTNLAPVVSARVIVHLSWRWAFWLCAITLAVVLALAVAFLPETSYSREQQEAISSVASDHKTTSTPENSPPYTGEKSPETSAVLQDEENVLGEIKKVTPAWKKILGIGHVEFGTPSQTAGKLIAPLTLLWHPAIIWACVLWMVTFTWIIIQGGIATQVWGSEPYNLSPLQVGDLVGVAPLIGSLLGCLVGGSLSDWAGRALSTRNSGIYEPEFRLVIMTPAILLMAAGSFGLGEVLMKGEKAVVTGVFLAIINASVGVACTCIVSYTNDVASHRAGEAFGLAMLLKSAYAFGLTFCLNNYYVTHGPRVFFDTWGALTVGPMLLTIPLYVYGKRLRAWTDRWS